MFSICSFFMFLIFVFFFFRKWKRNVTNGRSRKQMGTSRGHTGGRRNIKDLIRHAPILCGAQAPQDRAPRGNMARQLSGACPKGREGKGKRVVVSMDISDSVRFRKDAEGPSKIKPAVVKTAEKMEGQARVRLGASKNKKRTRI